ncbi:MAG: DedA family protein, partial [Minisyncoccia bacterium]
MFNLATWIHVYGSTVAYLIISGIIFAESGLFFGFFLPGDSILFPAGILASQGIINLTVLCILAFVAAVLGNAVGYLFGKHVGKKLFQKKDSRFFRKKHIIRAHEFYERHGGKTILLARFIPIVRTFGPIVAGVSDMNFISFIAYSMLGAMVWAVGLPVAGYYLGRSIPDVDKYLLPIIF